MVERETKTKTFSKEGLSMAAKMDPAEKAKMEVRDWINSCTERLNMQIDQFEAEIEQLNGKRKKKTDRVLEGTFIIYHCTSVAAKVGATLVHQTASLIWRGSSRTIEGMSRS